MRISDWSSDVCSSDLLVLRAGKGKPQRCTDERPGPFARVFALPVEQSFKVGFLVLELGWRHIWIAYAHRPSALSADRGEQSKVVALRDRSEEHTSELQSLMRISYAVFCLKKKKTSQRHT